MTAPAACPHMVREDGVCAACGHCVHEVILNGACVYCGSDDIDGARLSPKPVEAIIPVARLTDKPRR